jgi:hypothetical protein
MDKINDRPVPLRIILNGLPKTIPIELVNELSTWETIIKSPYGFSYYNAPVNWGFKTDKSLCIADHWNFTSKGQKHCCTTRPVPNNTHWTLARYNAELNAYVPICIIHGVKKSIKTTSIFESLMVAAMTIGRLKTI